MPLDPTIRLVKGAYREPDEIVFRSRAAISEAYRRLALLILTRKGPTGRLALGTHDVELIRTIEADLGGHEGFEVHMLYGIRQNDLLRMARRGIQGTLADRVRHVLVPVVHASDRREPDEEHPARAPEPRRTRLRLRGSS